MKRPPIWLRRIAAAKKRGYFTPNDKYRAGNWTTCACGEITADIPRDAGSEPYDRRLSALGFQFYDRVADNNFVGARKVLLEIEKRAKIVASRTHS